MFNFKPKFAFLTVGKSDTFTVAVEMILKRKILKGKRSAAPGFDFESPQKRVSGREAVKVDSEARGDETERRDAAR